MKEQDFVRPPSTSSDQPDGSRDEEAKASNAATQEVNVKKKKERSANEVRFTLCPKKLVVLILQ